MDQRFADSSPAPAVTPTDLIGAAKDCDGAACQACLVPQPGARIVNGSLATASPIEFTSAPPVRPHEGKISVKLSAEELFTLRKFAAEHGIGLSAAARLLMFQAKPHDPEYVTALRRKWNQDPRLSKGTTAGEVRQA